MKNILCFLIIILTNIFNKVSTQVANNFNTLYVNSYNDNQNVNLGTRDAVLLTTNQNPILQTQYISTNVPQQNVVILNPIISQPETTQYYVSEPQFTTTTHIVQGANINRPALSYDTTQYTNNEQSGLSVNYQNTQHVRTNLAVEQYSANTNNNNGRQQSRSSSRETQHISNNNAPQRRSSTAQQQQQAQQYYSNEPQQERYYESNEYSSSSEQQSQEVKDYNGNRSSGSRGRALGHNNNGKNRNKNSLTRGNSQNAKLKNINKAVAKHNEREREREIRENIEQFQYQYSQGWSTNEAINKNEIVRPRLEYHKNSKYSTPNTPEAQYYQKFYNIYNDVENHRRTNDVSENEMDSINDDFNGRSIVAPGQYPHMAAIGFLSNQEKIEFKCGGSLISDSFVITAAHCCSLSGETPIIVKLGIINLKDQTGNIKPQRKAIKEIIVHPSYNASMNYHDIALLKLQSPVEFTKFVRPILLWASDKIPYERVFTMGYGSTSFAKAPTNILTELSLSLIPLEKCKQLLPHDDKTPYGILDSQLCGRDLEKNRDTCQGDSGGPLQLNLEQRNKRNYYRYYLVGIISYGEFCGSKKPGVYTRVSSYCQWIASIVWPEHFQVFQ